MRGKKLTSEKSIENIDLKKKELDKDFEPLQIIFEIKDVKQLNKINEGIFYNVKAECSRTVVSLLEKIYVLHYRTREIALFSLPTEHRNIKEQYRDIISNIQITNQFKSEKQINLSECKEITLEECVRLINSFTKEIEDSLFEVILNNSVLGSLEGSRRQKILENLGISEDYTVLKELLGKSKSFTFQDTSKIFQIINTKNYFLLKTIFYFLIEKGNKNLEDYISRFHQIKGRPPFLPEELNDVKKSLTLTDIILEIFFKNYILLENIAEKVFMHNKDSKTFSKITIPLDHIAYDFEKSCGKDVVNLIRKCFQEDPKSIQKAFKKVLTYEIKRIKGFKLRNTIISFDYADTEENRENLRNLGIYYDSIVELFVSKKKMLNSILKQGELDSEEDGEKKFTYFCIFKGNYQEFRTSEFTRDRLFTIKDGLETMIECRIKKNKGYYDIFELGTETVIEVQSILHITYWHVKEKGWELKRNYFLEILDLKILKGFRPLRINMGSDHIGESLLENTHKGLSLYKYTHKGLVYHKNILAYPLELLQIYEGENDFFYECRINNSIVVKTKVDLYKYLEEETNSAFISGKELKDAITNVLRKSQEDFNIKVYQMYHTAGVFFTRETHELIVVHPFKEGLKVIGENDVQYEYIERIKERGIDFEGKLTKAFYNILHIETMKEDVRIGIFGYAAIHPFFYALANAIDVFPNFFAIGVHGSGKTTLTEIMINHLYGTKMKSSDSIDSPSRLTKYSTESTSGMNIDDIDEIVEKQMNWIKTNSTRKLTRDRMTKDQKMVKEQTYTPYIGSANSKDFLTGNINDAFRKRCLIFELMERINLKEDTKKFETIKTEIAEGKIYGFYLLEKAIEFFEKLSDKSISSYNKIVRYINDLKEKLTQLFIEKEIFISDVRRVTIYTLIYIGLQIWDYIFRENKLESPLLCEILDLKKERFTDFVEKLEETERDLTLTVFDNILYFYESKKSIFGKERTPNDEIVLTSNFTAQYDEFARKRGYDILGNLVKLGDLQSQILNREIKPKTIYVKEKTSLMGKSEHGIIFYYEEITNLRKKIIKNALEVNNGPGAAENLKIEKVVTEEKIKKEKAIVNRIEEIFKEN